jgi:putative PIN family toxin of toxin-antitoxin system
VVLDTNVVYSAFLWGGIPGSILDVAVVGDFTAVSSLPLIEELRRVLSYPRSLRRLIAMGKTGTDILEQYETLVEIVQPAVFPSVVVRSDPADDQVLRAAVGGDASLIVSGNDHLLDLQSFRKIQIVSPSIFHSLISR